MKTIGCTAEGLAIQQPPPFGKYPSKSGLLTDKHGWYSLSCRPCHYHKCESISSIDKEKSWPPKKRSVVKTGYHVCSNKINVLCFQKPLISFWCGMNKLPTVITLVPSFHFASKWATLWGNHIIEPALFSTPLLQIGRNELFEKWRENEEVYKVYGIRRLCTCRLLIFNSMLMIAMFFVCLDSTNACGFSQIASFPIAWNTAEYWA